MFTVSQFSALATLPARLQPGTTLFRGPSSPAPKRFDAPHAFRGLTAAVYSPRFRSRADFLIGGDASACHVLCLHIAQSSFSAHGNRLLSSIVQCSTHGVTVTDGSRGVVIIRFLLFLVLVTSLLPIPICLTLFACNSIRSRSLTTKILSRPRVLLLTYHTWDLRLSPFEFFHAPHSIGTDTTVDPVQPTIHSTALDTTPQQALLPAPPKTACA